MKTTQKRKLTDMLVTIALILSCTVFGLTAATLIPEEEVTEVAIPLDYIDVGASLHEYKPETEDKLTTLAYTPENSNWRVVSLANVIEHNAERGNDISEEFDPDNSRSPSMSAMNSEEVVETEPVAIIPEEEKPIDHNDYYFGMIDYTEEELFYVAAEIYVESRGEPYTGKVGVGATIVNRLMHPDFPDTIYKVITQEDQYASISWVTKAMIDQVPECWEAAIEALNGIDPTFEMTGEHALYFYNPAGCSQYQLNARANIKNTCTIGAHIFYRNW